jgi:hypothetical protein
MENQTASFPEDVVLLLGSAGDVSDAHVLVSNLLVPKHTVMAIGRLPKKVA